MYTIKNIILLFISITFYSVFSEGTKEIAPTGTNDTRMLLKRYYDYSEFARYGAQKTERLNFTICGPNETVYFGFNANDNTATKLRVKRWLDDAVVFNEIDMPTSGEGFSWRLLYRI